MRTITGCTCPACTWGTIVFRETDRADFACTRCPAVFVKRGSDLVVPPHPWELVREEDVERYPIADLVNPCTFSPEKSA